MANDIKMDWVVAVVSKITDSYSKNLSAQGLSDEQIYQIQTRVQGDLAVWFLVESAKAATPPA